MQVSRYEIFPVEAIVRGYITGSAWTEYKTHGTIHGIDMPSGLAESQKLPSPLYTPSTKAEAGQKDENIHPDRVIAMIGLEHATAIAGLSVALYEVAHELANSKGIILADTKFEFGLDRVTNQIVLVDEVLTPDSSRFWPADSYEIGSTPPSFDKQYLRDWLTTSGLKGREDVQIPAEVVQGTFRRYREAVEKLTGRRWTDDLDADYQVEALKYDVLYSR